MRHEHRKIANTLLDTWSDLSFAKRTTQFRKLPRAAQDDLFLRLSSRDQHTLLCALDTDERLSWLRILAPNEAASLVLEFLPAERPALLALLDHDTRADVEALLAYSEDEAGGIMNPRFVRLRPAITVDVAVRYLRAQAHKQPGTIHYAYVVSEEDKLVGAVSFRELLLADPARLVSEVMSANLITIPDELDPEETSHRFANSKLSALPVVDKEGHIKGIVTLNEMVSVVQQAATEDMQKIGGVEVLDAPYLEISILAMVKKRAGWLVILFVGELFTATAMGYYEREIEKAVVLALFIPLIISSGGNSGSQASTLIIRAMALGEVRLKDWWRVFHREVLTGLALGSILGSIGLVRILLWPTRATLYGAHYGLIALTVSLSLIGIVLWGSLAGSMLPFVLRKLGFDPATASAPFVATLVDVTGLVIYFTVASVILRGALL